MAQIVFDKVMYPQGEFLKFLVNPNPNGSGDFRLHVWGINQEPICTTSIRFDDRVKAQRFAQSLEDGVAERAKKHGSEMAIFWIKKAGPNQQFIKDMEKKHGIA